MDTRNYNTSMNTSISNTPTYVQFTIKEEKDGKLFFLDVQVTRSPDRLTTPVYRKPTHMDRYISFHSHHHQRTTTGVLRCMRDRAHQICSNTTIGA